MRIKSTNFSMKKIMNFFVKLFFEIWEFPQNLSGFIMLMYNTKICKHEFKKVETGYGITFYYVKHVNDCGVSLGKYIFLDNDRSISQKAVMHEHGHQLQSKRWGWFYLPVIGLLSAIGNTIYRKTKWKPFGDYYKQPWERQADKLGGVER